MNVRVLEFSTLRISSVDVARSREWYEAFFGIAPFEVLEHFVSFKINSTCLDIVLADEKSPYSPGGSVGYWLVDSIESVISRAEELGGEVYRGPLRVDEIQRTIVQIMDPIGNVMGFEAKF
jgi:predicted enzyme related to lactoylglutathione lyase